MANITIYDVARKAGVSIATVSRVINSPHQVNETTRQTVLAVIDQLGFVPKVEAMARARRRNQRIGVLAPFFTVPSFVERLRGVAGILNGSPYEMVVYNVDTPAHCRHYLESLPMAQRIDGLIVMSLRIHDRVAERLKQLALPTVLIETVHPTLSGVEIDNEAGGRLAADYLLGQGHRRLGFVGGDSEIPGYTLHTSELRLAGYRRALHEASITLPEAYVRSTQNSMDYARQEAHILFDLPAPPTAIFAASDTLAMGVLKAARERGLRTPDDVAVLGFDDLEIADFIGLTTIGQSLIESGRIAVELLLARMAEPARPVQHVRLDLRIIPRETA
jgi:DNA-binding LacI/PurR family transcriptional regulator